MEKVTDTSMMNRDNVASLDNLVSSEIDNDLIHSDKDMDTDKELSSDGLIVMGKK